MKNYLLLLALSLFFVGCSTKHPHLETVKSVDIQKYKGTWYEIARFEHFFEKGCKNVTATYELKSDGDIKVINRCTMIEDNKQKEAFGVAYPTDETNSKLKVSFFRPFYGDYYILDVASDYSYALVGAPSRELLWILSRTKTIDESTKEKILAQLPKLGFDKEKFIWTIQE
ncbi:MAG: lipocalin family protein [Arcobacteraceae bacterium]|nr:lipocalin family protein [Arcobacteraceae bacterium]